SYTRGTQDHPLLALTIGQAFDNTVAAYPQGEALVVRHQQLRYTWQQLREAVDQHARALLALGLKTGDRLGIWAPNCAQWCIAQFASAKIGAILVNINPAYRSSELEYVLRQSGCQWLICAGAFKTSDYHGMLQGLVPELAEQSIGQLHSERLPELRGVISLDAQPPSGFLPWSQLTALAAGATAEQL
ncbi:AMP-binding protein, partial [Pseudomonas sp. MWU13-2625]